MSELEFDIEFLVDLYASARNKYKPAAIETLLLAEAPPHNLERFFYYEDVKSHDSLFLEIMGVLYPEQKQKYLKAGRPTHQKEELLRRFQSDGYWLLNVADIPLSYTSEALADFIPSLLKKLKTYIQKTTPVILIKASVYETVYAVLAEEGYNVINDKIPFPGSGQQGVFRKKFKKALEG